MGFCYTVPRCSQTRPPTVFKDKHRPWGFSLGMLDSRGPSPWQEPDTCAGDRREVSIGDLMRHIPAPCCIWPPFRGDGLRPGHAPSQPGVNRTALTPWGYWAGPGSC